ncbi:uncharacterized protein LOC113279080 [Papaver somniferum]|uniref:uncharacterized protein LOC113279080 n=1 Tax=Papaver somniferum TaxID=3469 RepID=UPI000E6FCA04|nr:uncharacterized protein LOC113279080 [Papaver somniferum]
MAETNACYLGLKEVILMRPSHLHLEMDSETLVHWLTSPCLTESTYPWQLYHLLADIHKILNQIPNVNITHIYREGNQVADALANRGADKAADPTQANTTEIWMDTPLLFLTPLLVSDRAQTPTGRVTRIFMLIKSSFL